MLTEIIARLSWYRMIAMTDHCQFSVHYEGPSTEDHKIDAGDLATSLAGFNDALSAVARYTYGEDVSCRLLVDASIREGSTIADLLFVVVATGAVAEILPMGIAWDKAKAAVGTLVEVWKLYKEFKGKPIPEDACHREGDRMLLVFNNSTVNIGNIAADMYRDDVLRIPLKKALQPATRDPENRIELLQDKKVLETATSQEAEALDDTEDDTLVEVQNLDNAIFDVRRVSLDGDKQWGVSFFGQNFTATIQDREFLRKVANREIVFGHGDRLKVNAKIERPSNGGRIRCTINKVVAYIQYEEKQPSLF